MKPSINPPLPSHKPLPADARVLLLASRALKRAALSGSEQPLLKGKHVALMCDEPRCGCATAFADAATALGARVSRIHAEAAMPPEAARLLGQLYDAIDCELMPATVAWELQQQVSVPVYDGLGRVDHPLMDLLEPNSTDDDRRFLRQALLLRTIG
jgi:ornithine carbamoyltransferase